MREGRVKSRIAALSNARDLSASLEAARVPTDLVEFLSATEVYRLHDFGKGGTDRFTWAHIAVAKSAARDPFTTDPPTTSKQQMTSPLKRLGRLRA